VNKASCVASRGIKNVSRPSVMGAVDAFMRCYSVVLSSSHELSPARSSVSLLTMSPRPAAMNDFVHRSSNCFLWSRKRTTAIDLPVRAWFAGIKRTFDNWIRRVAYVAPRRCSRCRVGQLRIDEHNETAIRHSRLTTPRSVWCRNSYRYVTAVSFWHTV